MIVFAYACLRREFRALMSQRPDSGEIPAPDAVHRTRIAARRLRVALKTFKHLLPARAASLRAELRWFARALGDVRDLDVYTSNLSHYAEAVCGDPGEFAEYAQHVHAVRDAARAQLPALFADPRFLALLESFAAFLENSPSSGALRRWRSFSVRKGARAYLQKSIKRIVKRGDKIVAGSAARDLHRLRIMAKHLRYELEFFAAAFPSLQGQANVVKRLQDVLGEYQDACTASARVRGYIRERGRAPGALRALLHDHEQLGAAAERRFELEWRSFKKNLSVDELRERLAA
jgi:CHAD domain-containing protein